VLTDFLKQIVPDDSILCLSRSRAQANATIGRPSLNFDNRFFTPAEMGAAESTVADWNKGKDTDVYFAVGGYLTKASRKKTNVAGLRVLVLDVDLWSEKLAKQPGKHPDQFWHSKVDVVHSLKRLGLAVPTLPAPLVVDSGGGYHVYYRISETLPQARWLPLAEAFRDTVRTHEPKLLADPVRTCDAASVLRLPGSYNAKIKGNPILVKVVLNGATSADYDTLMQGLGVASQNDIGLAPAYAQGVNLFAVSNPHQREFKDIDARPVLTGCGQMRHHLEVMGAVDEPAWVRACRVFVTLRDGRAIAQKFADPAYRGMIANKLNHAANNFDAPSTACKEWPNRDICNKCQWRGKVLFPVEIAALDTQQREADEARQLALQQAATVAINTSTTTGLPLGYLPMEARYEQVITASGAEFTHVPGVRGDNPNETMPLVQGHINIKYITAEKTMQGMGDMRLHMDVTIAGHTSEVTVPIVELTSERIDTCTKTLRTHGLTFDADSAPKKKALSKMFSHMVAIGMRRVVPYFPRKGWDVDYPFGRQPLIVGAMRYSPNGDVERGSSMRDHKGSSSSGQSLVEAFCSGVSYGSLAAWQQAMAIYDRPKMELAQMLMLSGVSNLLLPLISQSPGGILLALTGKAGVGKTTLLKFMSSLIGSPKDAMIPGASTSNALVSMLSQAGFLLLPVDDSFKMDAQALSLLLTSVSSGMEKARMSGSSDDGWTAEMGAKFHSSMIVTTNYDIGTIIGSGRATDAQMLTDAARSRLLEVSASAIHVPDDVTQGQWRAAETLLLDNYGHALDVFSTYVATRQAAVGNELREAETLIHTELVDRAPIAAKGMLRFWAKYLACVKIAGLVLTKHQPILPWDVEAIIKAGINLVIEHDEEAADDKEDTLNQLWDIMIDDEDGRRYINFSYFVAAGGGSWPAWDDSEANQVRGRLRDWDDTAVGTQLIRGVAAPGATMVRLHTAFEWRVMLTRVVDGAGVTTHYEREVVTTLPSIESLINRFSGRSIKVTDWVELYDAFQMNGAVSGVKGHKPKRYAEPGRGGCRVPINQQQGTGSGERRRCIKLTFPPLRPDEVEPA